MTTVGYGDKAPKSYLGKLFSVPWIFAGIAVTSTLSAALTTELINFRSLQNTEMDGKRVGVLKHRLHDAIIVSQHGGIVHTATKDKTVFAIAELIKSMQHNDIDGFLLNRNTFYYFNRRLKAEKYKSVADSVSDVDILRTEKVLKGEKLSCGMLMKNSTDFHYFAKYFKYNKLQVESCNTMRMNYKKTDHKEVEVNLFAVKGGPFISFLSFTLIVLAFAVCFGVSFEIRRYYKDGKLQSLQRLFQLLKGLPDVDFTFTASVHCQQSNRDLA